MLTRVIDVLLEPAAIAGEVKQRSPHAGAYEVAGGCGRVDRRSTFSLIGKVAV